MVGLKKLYTVSQGNDGKYYAKGPGWQNGYDSGTMCPHLRVDTEEEAQRIADVANIAYREGCVQTQANIKQALGVI